MLSTVPPPVPEMPMMPSNDASTSATEAPLPAQILVIDDDPIVREMMISAMTQAGYRAHGVGNGKQAILWLQENAASLVISDIFMPEGDGLEVIRYLRQAKAHIPILAVSGGNPLIRQDYLVIAQQLGADQVLSKPIRPHDLLRTVKSLLEAEPSQSSAQ